MLKDKIQRNKRKAARRKLAKKSSVPVVNLDAFRRLRFEGTLRRCVRPYLDALPTPDVIRSIRRTLRRVLNKFARSKRHSREVSLLVTFEADSESLVIRYFKGKREINVYDVYDAINPGSKKLIGMHVGSDGARRPVMQGDTTP